MGLPQAKNACVQCKSSLLRLGFQAGSVKVASAFYCSALPLPTASCSAHRLIVRCISQYVIRSIFCFEKKQYLRHLKKNSCAAEKTE